MLTRLLMHTAASCLLLWAFAGCEKDEPDPEAGDTLRDAGSNDDAPKDASIDPDACTGDPGNDAACPCKLPIDVKTCAPVDLVCGYDPHLCACKADGFHCHLPLL